MEKGKDRADHAMDGETEREIDAVLALASEPAPPEGALARLMARIEAEPQQAPARVLAFPGPRAAPPRSKMWRYAAAVPLAASLALGIYLGARGSLDFMMPAAITGDVASNDDGQIDDLGGAGDAEAIAQDGTT